MKLEKTDQILDEGAGPEAALDDAALSLDEAETSLSDLWQPDEAGHSHGSLEDRLHASGALTAERLEYARQTQAKSPGRAMRDILLELGVDEVAIQSAVAEMSGLGFQRVEPGDVHELLLHRLGVDYCQKNKVIPLGESGSRILIGMTQSNRLFLLDEIRRKLGRSAKVVLVTSTDLLAAIEALTAHKKDEQAIEPEENHGVDEIIADIAENDVEVVETKEDDVDLEKEAAESPVIRMVNYLIYDAVRNGASDIHIEPQEKKLRVRYRIDGILHEMMTPPRSMHSAIISRLKIMSNLDISERRLPADGRIRAMVHGRKLDLRLSTLPTGQGEKAVLRILDQKSIKVTLDNLGMPEDTLAIWKHQIDQPHGIVLVTGPTGSGKTTTLYSSLGQMDRNKLNISTVEDPIEYHLDGINQVQTHEKIGMSFSAALRSLLRQDPDVVLVGEIRDEETARIAIQASMTGHMVLSTLHTNDAPSTITRLINIGVEPYLIAAAVNAVLAQRLVRRICPNCRKQVKPPEEIIEHLEMHGLNSDFIFKGEGCPKCHNTGYSGRVGIYELLVMDDSTRDAVAAKPDVTAFRRLCVDRGMLTLRMDGFRKVPAGLTTVEEVLRVTQSTI